MLSPGLGESQKRLLDAIKRRGTATIPDLAVDVELNVETVRDHLRRLTEEALVDRRGRRRSGPGRPEILYALTDLGNALFPTRDAELLQALARYLVETGNHDLLEAFYAKHLERRRESALRRVSGLEGRARLEEAARVLTEEGFMARIEEDGAQPVLRLCHCPVRALVDVTRMPCRAEVAFVHELLGERLARVSYIPSGDAACRYTKPDPSSAG
jgi:predicted ArsR family transcriptional regulator